MQGMKEGTKKAGGVASTRLLQVLFVATEQARVVHWPLTRWGGKGWHLGSLRDRDQCGQTIEQAFEQIRDRHGLQREGRHEQMGRKSPAAFCALKSSGEKQGLRADIRRGSKASKREKASKERAEADPLMQRLRSNIGTRGIHCQATPHRVRANNKTQGTVD